jgi:DHA2 family multidrug resistance protein-like MFS transporter
MSLRARPGYTGMNTSHTPTPRAGRREWIALAVIALPCLLYSMDLSVLYLALPSLSAALKPSPTQLLWISDIYGFLLAGFLLTMGVVGDRIGRRRLLLIGAGMFGLASVLAAFATSVAMLIVARGLLGIAASTLAPSTLSLIRNMFLDDRQRTMAISVWVMSFSAGSALGPALGGLLLHFFWWGSVFLSAVPVMVALLVLGPILLPEFREPEPRPLDIPSAALSLGAVLALVYGIKTLAQNGLGPIPAASFVLGGALGLVFLRRQQTLAEPLLDLHLFRRPVFAVALSVNTLSMFLIFGVFFLTDQYLQLVLGLSPLAAGLWSVPPTFGFIAGSALAPVLTRRCGPVCTMTYGLAVAAAGLIVLTQLPGRGGYGLALTLSGTGLLALGVSPVVALATDVILGAVPPEKAGQASGLSETGTELGGALGIAVLGSLATAVYLSHPVAAAVHARTLSDAIHSAAHLPDRLATPLVDAARVAFTQGLHVAAVAGAVVAVLLAALVAIVLRREGAPAGTEALSADAVGIADELCAPPRSRSTTPRLRGSAMATISHHTMSLDGIYGGRWDGQVFILTHHPPERDADPRVTFLSGDLPTAVAIAHESAGAKDVGIFGASLTCQCLREGLLDEIVIHLAPVLLGDGVRLFGGDGEPPVRLERLSFGEAERGTDLHFRVVSGV